MYHLRNNIIEDFLEFENCHFHSKYGIHLRRPAEEKMGFISGLSNSLRNDFEKYVWQQLDEQLRAGLTDQLTARVQ